MEEQIGIEVELLADYAVVCETLERIGVVNKREKLIYPSCYCLNQNDKFYVCHFKEMFKLNNKPSTFNKLDRLRLQTIVYFLKKWNLVKVVDEDEINEILSDKIDVVKHSDKKDYKVIHKFRYSSKN